jgi:hypothetical protein
MVGDYVRAMVTGQAVDADAKKLFALMAHPVG